jgi:ATP-binding cassette subfamily B (MDR/TAP) protein 8
VKPEILLMIAVMITAIAAALVNLATPKFVGELVDVVAQTINGRTLCMADLKRPAARLMGLFVAQGPFRT